MSHLVDIVVTALFLLDGHKKSVDTEDVAVKAHELAPDRFSWKKYPEQINFEIVRVSLSDGKKEANGGLIEGSGREGWRLSPAGLRWAQEHAPRVEEADHSRLRSNSQAGSIDERRWRSERARLIATAAWQSWSRDAQLSTDEALEVFRIDVYSRGKLRSRKITRLTAMFAQDGEIAPFLVAAENALPPT